MSGRSSKLVRARFRDSALTPCGAHSSGNAFSPLSLLCIGAKNYTSELETYDPAVHLAQDGTGPIVSVPFTVQPWTVWERIKARLGDGLRWDAVDAVVDVQKDTREVMVRRVESRQSWLWVAHHALRDAPCAQMACYPVYVPIYIAEYAHKEEGQRGQGRRMTVVMDASTDVGRLGACAEACMSLHG